MMRILIATDNYPPRYDGISRFLMEVIPALDKVADVSVIAPDFGPTDDEWPVTKIGVTKLRVGDYHIAGLHFFKIFRRVRKCDVLFLQTLGTIGALALIAAKILGKRIVLYTHAIEWELVPRALKNNLLRRSMPGLVKAIDRMFYNWIHLLLMPGASVSETYSWNKIDTKRRIISLGVDTKHFKASRSKKTAKEKLGIDPGTFVIGYHGRLSREKDLRTLLRGFVRFRAKHKELDVKLLVVGDGIPEVREMLEQAGATVTGFQEDVTPYLQAMDVYVLSSVTETSSLSVMEAMACELPVISTSVGFIQDYISSGENGLLYSVKDSVMLAHHLESLTNETLRKRLGKAARKTITQQFSWENTRKQIVDVFEGLKD